jgi:tetratricopeptide (TPR) repeat protein
MSLNVANVLYCCVIFATFPIAALAMQESESVELGSAEAEVKIDPLANAFEIYSQAFPNPKRGLYFEGELAFVVVILEKAKQLDSDKLEKASLLETLRTLREADIDAKVSKDLPPTSNDLLDTFDFLKFECRKVDALFATRRVQFNKIKSRVIESKFLGSDFRQCTALKASDLHESWRETATPTLSDTVIALKRRIESLEEEHKALSELWCKLGSVDEVLNLANEESWLEWPMNSFGESSGDSLDLVRMIRSIDNEKEKANRSSSELRTILQAIPGLPEAFAELAKRALESDDYARALNFSLLSQIEGKEFIKPQSVIMQWQSKCEATRPQLSQGLKELGLLLDRIKINRLAFNQIEHPAIAILKRSWNTIGNINPPQKIPRVKRGSAASYQGKDGTKWPDIRVLDDFYNSFCENPRNFVAWQELGMKAKESDDVDLAIVCLRQAIRLGSKDIQSRILLAQCYQTLGNQQLFLSTALAAALQDKGSDAKREEALLLLDSALKLRVERSEKK